MSTKTHWKKLTNPNYLGSYDFDENEVRTLTIQSVQRETVIGVEGKKEECTVVRFTTGKPMILNATNAKTITKVSGSPYIENWSGVSVMVYATKVRAFGELMEALRIKTDKVKGIDTTNAINLLNKATNKDELSLAWSGLTVEEKKAPNVIALKDKLKTTLP